MRLPCLFLLLLFPAAVLAADTTNQDGITPEGVRAHIEFLADDLLEGRETGTRGHEIAARYVASQYLSMGLTPGTEKGWFQRVPLATLALDEARSTLSVAGQHFTHRQDVLIAPLATSALKPKPFSSATVLMTPRMVRMIMPGFL
jgi:hypothetical protein